MLIFFFLLKILCFCSVWEKRNIETALIFPRNVHVINILSVVSLLETGIP